MHRRNALKMMTAGAAGTLTLMESREAFAQEAAKQPDHEAEATENANRGVKPITIEDVKVINTSIDGRNFTIAKVYTSEPGLYGVGEGSHHERPWIVSEYLERYVIPQVKGRRVDEIEKLWREMWIAPYWRASIGHSSAMSAIDGALWDIMGKRTGQPLYNLLGGKVRDGLRMFGKPSGRTNEAKIEDTARMMEEGFHHFRYHPAGAEHGWTRSANANDGAWTESLVNLFTGLREAYGYSIDIGTDVHNRLTPPGALVCAKAIEETRPFFVEDLFAMEDGNWYEVLREQSAIGIAHGETFVNNNEWIELVANRWIDYFRMHVSACGGITICKRIADTIGFFGVQTSWHGPGSVSPIGHAQHMHIDYAIQNFGIAEGATFSPEMQELFPGSPTKEGPIQYLSERPGLGVDIDEAVAAKFPMAEDAGRNRGKWDLEGAPRNP